MKSSSAPRLKATGLLKTILRIANKRKVKLYLVGGYLRDILLGREKENPDANLIFP
jgi:tRNA nucleotidyltransferase/poly(A) polymerase